MHFKVRYLDFDGRYKTRSVEADTSSEACASLTEIPPDRVTGCTEDKIAKLKKTLIDEKLSLQDQASFLASYTAAIAGGEDQTKAIDRLAAQKPKFQKKLGALADFTRPSDKLKILNFDPQVILLARVGENSGRLIDLVGQAADDIIKRNEILSDAVKKLLMPVILAVIGIGMMIGLPLGAVPTVKPILEMSELQMDTTFATHAMIAMDSAYRSSWWLILMIVGALVTAIIVFWRKIERLPGFRLISDVASDRRSVMFLLTFPPLFEGGVRPETALSQLADNSTGRNREIFEKMRARLQEGASLSETFEKSEWSELLCDSMGGVDNITPSESEAYFSRVRPLSVTKLNKDISKVVSLFAVIGVVLALSSLAMVIGGMLFPIMSATPSM